jgi:hypothetical protein
LAAKSRTISSGRLARWAENTTRATALHSLSTSASPQMSRPLPPRPHLRRWDPPQPCQGPSPAVAWGTGRLLAAVLGERCLGSNRLFSTPPSLFAIKIIKRGQPVKCGAKVCTSL